MSPRPVDPALVEVLGHLLVDRHLGTGSAATWEALRRELEREGVHVNAVRRLQEAAAVLRARRVPVIGLSGGGVCIARDVDEVDAAIGEKRRRAIATLGDLRTLKRIRLTMLGQTEARAS